MSDSGKPLGDVSVVDFGLGLAGALVARMLADLGAKIRRFEPESGDPFHDVYAAYRVWQCGKEISSAASVGAAMEMAAGALAEADICVIGGEDYPGLAWRPDAEALAAAYPRLVILEIASGPHGTEYANTPAVDLLVQARSGMVFEHYTDRPFLYALPVASYGAALQGLLGLLAGLCARERIGRGQIVRGSLFEGTLSWLGHLWCLSERTDRSMDFTMPKNVHPLIFRCADGAYVHFTLGTAGARANVYGLLGIDDPTLKDDPRGLPSIARGARNFFGDIDLLQSYVANWQSQDLLRGLWALGLPAEAVKAAGDAWDDEQVTHNGTISREKDGMRRVGLPFRIKTDAGTATGPEAAAEPATAPPLKGVRIVDFGSFTAGPHASMILADLGADVIKVEPLSGDPARGFYRPFSTSSRGKRAIAVDMKKPEGLDIALRLCRSADMVHHNFRPGVTKRLGMDVATIRGDNPALIVLENSGYGAEGPKSERGGLDMIFQAFCGHEQRAAGIGNAPVCYRSSTIDFAAGLIGAIAALAAQFSKERTGGGAEIATSLLDTGLFLLSELVQAEDGRFIALPQLNADQTGFHPAEQLYPVRDGWIAISARTDDMARRLLAVLDLKDEIASPRGDWGPAEARAIAAATARFDGGDLLKALDQAEVWAAECTAEAPRKILEDPALRRGGTTVLFEHPRYGEVAQIGALFSLSRSTMTVRGESPRLGQETREILAELDYSEADIDRLYHSGVVA